MGMGYYVVNPVVNGKNVLSYVHHLVAIAFLGEPLGDQEVNHKDGDKTNNRLDNLEYVTHRENMRHARHLGLVNQYVKYSRETINQVLRLAQEGHKSPEIEKRTGVSARHCRDIISGKLRSIR